MRRLILLAALVIPSLAACAGAAATPTPNPTATRAALTTASATATRLALASPAASPGRGTTPALPSTRPVLTIGHRGAAGEAPEHTFASYDLALERGADYIEQDLQQTRDGVLVVLHDETLDRTARGPDENCRGRVADKTMAQLKTCDAGRWFNEANPQAARDGYLGQQIPTLEEVFQRYGQRVNYYVETKNPEEADRMEERLVALIDRYGLRRPAAERRQVLIQSFSPASLHKLHDLAPDLPLVQLYYSSETSATIRAQLDEARTYAVGIGPAREDVDAALVAAAHERCLDVHPYTVDERAEMQALIAAGVDGMFTNYPDRLNQARGANPAATPDLVAARRAAEAGAACRGTR